MKCGIYKKYKMKDLFIKSTEVTWSNKIMQKR